MFGVFNAGILVGFWANKKEDNWAPITVQKLNLQEPTIYWYEVPAVREPELYRFDENKNLVIQERNELGEVVDTETVYTAEPYAI
jgi:hypothetical protein